MQQLTPVILLVVLIIVFWFVVLRPARNQQRTQAALQGSLEVGDEVVLSAGIFGTVRRLEESRVHLEVAPGTVVQVARQVVVRRVDDTGAVDGVDTPGAAVPAKPDESAGPDEPAGRDEAGEATVSPAATAADEPSPHDEPAKKAPAKKAPAKKSAAKRAPAKKATAKKAPAKKAPAKKTGSTAPATAATTATGAPQSSSPDGSGAVPGPAGDDDHEAVTLERSTDEAQDADRS